MILRDDAVLKSAGLALWEVSAVRSMIRRLAPQGRRVAVA